VFALSLSVFKERFAIVRLFSLALILLFFAFAFREYHVVLENVTFTPKVDKIVYPITVLGVSVDRKVVDVGDYVALKISFFVPYESGSSLFNFTVRVYCNGNLVYFAKQLRPCYPGEYAELKFRFKTFTSGECVAVFMVFRGHELVYEGRANFTVVQDISREASGVLFLMSHFL